MAASLRLECERLTCNGEIDAVVSDHCQDIPCPFSLAKLIYHESEAANAMSLDFLPATLRQIRPRSESRAGTIGSLFAILTQTLIRALLRRLLLEVRSRTAS